MVETRVLFVDDEVSLIKSLQRQMREMPYECYFLTDPRNVHEVLSERACDIIVTDEKMPHINGLDLVAQCKRSNKDLVCVLLTGEQDPKKLVTAINSGNVFKYLCKPCNIVELVQTIELAVKFKQVKARVSELVEEYKKKCELIATWGDIDQVKRQENAIDLSAVDLDRLIGELDSMGL